MKNILLFSVIALLFTAGVAFAASTLRSEALFILSDLLDKDSDARHPDQFKLLINVYFTGVKCLNENKVEMADKYFSLVKEYGKMLSPYFTDGIDKKRVFVTEMTQLFTKVESLAEVRAAGVSGPGKEVPAPEVDSEGWQSDSGDAESSDEDTVEPEPEQHSTEAVPNAAFNVRALQIIDRHIIPKNMTDGILINIADCMLYFFQDGRLKSQLPVVVGRAEANDERSWQTPLGYFRVTEKIKNPTWHIPLSIQKEMEDAGQEVQSEIPPGPDNPLGKFALRTSLPGILIHGTNVVSFKNGYKSHGCIRVSASKIESLFNEVKVNTAGEIIYRPIKIAANDAGRVFLEVHRDSYGNIKDMEEEVREAIAEYRLESPVDWHKVTRVVQKKSGFAEDISRTAGKR